MILSTHALVGAALGSFLPANPAAALALGFGSHFVLDAIPHWDYPIRSSSLSLRIDAPVQLDRALLLDVMILGADALLGILVAVLFFGSPENQWAILLGAFGAMLPDPLQVVHARFPHGPLRMLQRFHGWIHADKRISKAFPLGVTSQLILVAVVVWLTETAHHGVFNTAVATFFTTVQGRG
ncbi:hypothetical protein [Mesorhizobium sp. WSM4313]|uniref:hypothetical protein n=1 Tax=Mesorhizobium sp. WSM4313 TaxID=2029412 RepID=UPI001596A0F6|nr:hypothetical protein [Mesorhizobium sp. WSM4313]